jgi:hypothetical protein
MSAARDSKALSPTDYPLINGGHVTLSPYFTLTERRGAPVASG